MSDMRASVCLAGSIASEPSGHQRATLERLRPFTIRFVKIDNQAPVTQVSTCASAKIIAVVRRRWQPWSER